MSDTSVLNALSPLDGRYAASTRDLSEYFSEYALIRYRVQAEIEYFIAFCTTTKLALFSTEQTTKLRSIFTKFSLADAELVKAYEAKCHHDVKAVEYFLRDALANLDLANFIPYLHFGLTSEDTNSIAYGLALKGSRDQVVVPALKKSAAVLAKFAKKNAAIPILARTHGQAAIPTTFGKEYAVFLTRLSPELESLTDLSFVAKVSGAVGTYAAHDLVFPEINWLGFAQKFLQELGLQADALSTQVVSPESYIRYFQTLSRINNILLDCCRDTWQYISDGWMVQAVAQADVGSSTMPQKVNPIDFENAEGNFGLANALLTHFCQKLPISRLQRDLSDSTVKRSIGVALGYAALGYTSFVRGFDKISVNTPKTEQALMAYPETITEGLQTLLRADGVSDAYEILKKAARGKQNVTLEELRQVALKHAKTTATKQKIAKLSPTSYTGLAAQSS
ncbi:MAG: adenylosuccinate lyase [Candidatus Pacebacteria bacterium]|nr:adenylosuccinate lyase [Candidatus Paceibacterota bacterium]PIR60047.1 MAG: adenylosuccinate lyase [Candidatus Pacebacteria bacterium CG10_big_fil_rev_8_21_14_0_10_44_54]